MDTPHFRIVAQLWGRTFLHVFHDSRYRRGLYGERSRTVMVLDQNGRSRDGNSLTGPVSRLTVTGPSPKSSSSRLNGRLQRQRTAQSPPPPLAAPRACTPSGGRTVSRHPHSAPELFQAGFLSFFALMLGSRGRGFQNRSKCFRGSCRTTEGILRQVDDCRCGPLNIGQAGQ